MSGEKSKIDKAETIFFPLKLREDFNHDVISIRQIYAVPKGF
jgi:hypothetical protein